MYQLQQLLLAEVVDDETELTLAELCQTYQLTPEHVIEWVDYGVLNPAGARPNHWRFNGHNLRRVFRASRLRHDLGLNTEGIALTLDLLEEIQRLRAHIKRLEG